MSFVPSLADVKTTWRDVGKLFLEEIQTGAVNPDALINQITTLMTNATWIGAEPVRDAAKLYRASKSGVIASFLRPHLDPIFLAILLIAGSKQTTVEGGWRDIVEYLIAQGETIQTRAITFDTAPTTSGSGTPLWLRLTIDEDGFPIESVYAEDITARPINVQPNVQLGETVYELSTPASFDIFSLDIAAEKSSRALAQNIASVNSDNGFIGSSSFEVVNVATSSLTSFGSWLIDSADLANVEIVEDGYVESTAERATGKARTPAAVVKFAARLKADMSFSQDLSSVTLNNPYVWLFAVRRPVGTSAGTARMSVGTNQSCAQDVSLIAADTWVIVTPDLDENLWPKNFLEDDPKVTVQLSGLTGPHVDVDTVKFVAMTKFNGTWWAVFNGLTETLESYRAIFEDDIPADSVLQKLIFLALGLDFHAPSSATPSIAPVV